MIAKEDKGRGYQSTIGDDCFDNTVLFFFSGTLPNWWYAYVLLLQSYLNLQ